MNKSYLKKFIAFILSNILFLSSCITGFFATNDTRITGDPMIINIQKWLNQEYGKISGYSIIDEDGFVGPKTIKALVSALQHEMGTDVDGSFGPGSQKLYGKNPLKRNDNIKNNKYAILQSALWCKGYCPGYNIKEINGQILFNAVFDENVEKAVIKLKSDAGIINPDGTVTTNIMCSLLSMNSFVLLPSSYGSKESVRELQQHINGKYENYLGLMPCDGVFSAITSKNLIKALQIEEGLPKNLLFPNFGETTKALCPEIPYTINSNASKRYNGEYYNQQQINNLTELLQHSLKCNGFYNGKIDGIYSEMLKQSIIDFQNLYKLKETGIADLDTWMSLFISKGNPERSALACDCAKILDKAAANSLYQHGYRYVGRYLTGTYNGGISKAITRKEAKIIFDAKLRFFPIYQTNGRSANYFSAFQGNEDALLATDAAEKLGIPKGTIIYFAVDYDNTLKDIKSNIIPYFKSVSDTLKSKGYKVGIYGSRNVCNEVSALGYAITSFVSDMSTNWQGNLGYSIPHNWAFDQFSNTKISIDENEYLEIDKDGYSGKDSGVSHLEPITDLSLVELGDVDFDGVRDSEDYAIIREFITCKIDITPQILKIGDINKDGAVDSFDAILLDSINNGLINIM